MSKRNCEQCRATYATGKSYGDVWHVLATPGAETKGICEFCNQSSKWYIKRTDGNTIQNQESETA